MFLLSLRANYIKEDDFTNYAMSPATMMSGFSGEYYSLTDEDPEAQSYRSIGQIQKLLSPLLESNTGAQLHILGE